MRNYCTLFDSRYMPQGLALYESLVRHSSEPFVLYILPMNIEAGLNLKCLNLVDAVIVDSDLFESEMGMEAVKANRTYQEYCWTCGSNLAEYLMRCGLPEIAYLDADLFFFSDPAPVFDEIGARSIAITPHQFPESPNKARLMKSGIYNVGFIHFKNTTAGSVCLLRWAADVRDQCAANVGCGDQGYLDFFERDFGNEVCVLGRGVNAGPWNLSGYDVTERDGFVYVGDERLTCYHMHEYKHGERLTNYPLRPEDKTLVYAPYIAAVEQAKQGIAKSLYLQTI